MARMNDHYSEIRRQLKARGQGKRPARYSPNFVFPLKDSDPHRILFDDDSEEMIADGPFACGKTFINVMKLHAKALQTPGHYGIVRKVKESIKKSVCYTFAKVLGYDPLLTQKRYVKGFGGINPQLYRYWNGSVIHILGLNHLDGLLSTEFDGLYVNQAEELNHDEWQLLGRRTRDGKRPQIFGDCNPSFPKHFLAPGISDEITRFDFTHTDNPEYFDRDRKEFTEKGEREITKLKRMTGMRYRRGYLAEWCSAQGVVYEMYDPQRHDVDVRRADFGSGTRWYLSVDYGFKNPSSVGLWASVNSTHTLFKEIYETKLTVVDLLEKMDRMLSENRVERAQLSGIFCDHDAEHNEQLARAGYHVTLATKDVLPGIELVKNHLENGILKFNKNSLIHADPELVGKPQRLADELVVYSYFSPDKQTGTEKDEYPIDKDNHGCDMTRYLVMSLQRAMPDPAPQPLTYAA